MSRNDNGTWIHHWNDQNRSYCSWWHTHHIDVLFLRITCALAICNIYIYLQISSYFDQPIAYSLRWFQPVLSRSQQAFTEQMVPGFLDDWRPSSFRVNVPQWLSTFLVETSYRILFFLTLYMITDSRGPQFLDVRHLRVNIKISTNVCKVVFFSQQFVIHKYIYIPRAPMTSIFEGQPVKTRSKLHSKQPGHLVSR